MTMKHILLAMGLVTLSVRESRAQWAVFDAAVQAQMILSTAQEIAKFVQVIQNQVDQLKSLRDQASTLHDYVDRFGNPALTLPASAAALSADLRRAETGTGLGRLITTADPVAAMLDDGGGALAPIGTDFRTPDGVRVERARPLYRAVAAVQDTTRNFRVVADDARARRVALKAEIARTTDALATARTDAEVQKLTAVLVGLTAAVQGVESELQEAAGSAVVEDIAARADERRQADARREEQAAEFTEAVERHAQVFRLLTAPTAFPIP